MTRNDFIIIIKVVLGIAFFVIALGIAGESDRRDYEREQYLNKVNSPCYYGYDN